MKPFNATTYLTYPGVFLGTSSLSNQIKSKVEISN